MNLFTTLGVAVAIGMTLPAQQRANVGERAPDFAFPQFLNGDGRQRLADFYGHPVLIEYWGTH